MARRRAACAAAASSEAKGWKRRHGELCIDPRGLLSTYRQGLSRSLPEARSCFAAENLIDSSPGAFARIRRQLVSIEKPGISDFRSRRKLSRQKMLNHVERHMISAEDLLVGVKPEEFRLSHEGDRRFLLKFPRQSLVRSFSPLDPAPGQQPPRRIAVPHEENSSLSVDHQGAH